MSLIDHSERELVDAFSTQVSSVAVIARECDSNPYRGIGMSWVGNCPVFLFGFETKERTKLFAIGHTWRNLKVKWLTEDNETIASFANSLDDEIRPEDLDRIMSIMDITEMVMPFDPTGGVPIIAERLATVSSEEGILAILIWFHHGLQLGFVVGHFNELAVIFGAAVDQAFDAASKSPKSDIMVKCHQFPIKDVHTRNLLGKFDWFDYT